MAWFLRSKANIEEQQKREMPDGLWTKCPACGEIIYKTELEEYFFCCKKCGYHFRIGYKEYVNIILDENTFQETNTEIRSTDPLNFVDTKPYPSRLEEGYKKNKFKRCSYYWIWKNKWIRCFYCNNEL